MRIVDWTHRIDLTEEVQEIYLHRFLFRLALAAISIFLPLFIHDLSGSVFPVFWFYAIFYGTFILFVLPAALLATRIGYKKTSMLASPVIIGFYLLLRSLETMSGQVYLAAFLGGAGLVTYWIGMNAEMATGSHSDHRGQETGVFFSMPELAAVIAPLLGGGLITLYGFELLFLAVILLVVASFVPFLFSDDHYDGMDANLSAVFNRDHALDFATFVFNGMQSIGRRVVWPLYLAVIVTGALNIGGAGSAMALGGAVFSLLLGSFVDHHSKARIMVAGGLVTAATWVGMAFVTTPLQAVLISFVNGVIVLLPRLTLYSGVLDVAEHEDIVEYFAMREVGLCTGRITALAAVGFAFTQFNTQIAFLVSFGLVAAGSLGMAVAGTRYVATA